MREKDRPTPKNPVIGYHALWAVTTPETPPAPVRQENVRELYHPLKNPLIKGMITILFALRAASAAPSRPTAK